MCENESLSPSTIVSLIEVSLSPCDGFKKYPQTVSFGELNTFYGQVIIVAFTTGELDVDSVICVYTQSDIENTINTTIQSCMDGSAMIEYVFDWVQVAGGTHHTCKQGQPISVCELCMSDSNTCRIYNYTGIPGTDLNYDNTMYSGVSAVYPLSFDESALVYVGNNLGEIFKLSTREPR
ncbi:hypothetical protein LOD99_2984 [Oopsacas minuta]|uniref:Uncharacterized protein n=1 Tax=Oopsacas minuta TaxID=111878 RepID=A0AAV7K0M2_9METZ|nr:hypothetical protein LOD99_2984 [Oopsacas minuta]